MSKVNYFEYTMPSVWELREMYIVPYRFSQELRDYVKYMFEHPVHSKYRSMFTRLHREGDMNDMLKKAYLIIRYYKDHPQQYGNSMDNIVPHILVAMWKAFIRLHKQLRGEVFQKYYPMSMKLLVLGKGKLLDIFLSDMDAGNYIGSGDEMVIEREGVSLRGRKHGYSTEKALRFYESLDDR